MRDITIGIDLGTTGARAVIYDSLLAELGQEYYEYPLIRLPGERVEQDAGKWWSLTADAVRVALARCGADAGRVRAIGISSQGISVVPVDQNYHPVANAISWLDGRARAQLEQILSQCAAARLYTITGKRPAPTYTLPKLMWLKEHEPALYNACHKLLLPGDYLAARLTGRAITDHTMASGTMAYDLTERAWSREMLSLSGISIDKLPEIRWAGEPIGMLTETAAGELGLDTGVMVYTGGQDQKCAAFAAGLADGVLTLSVGTAAALTMKCGGGTTPKNASLGLFNFFSPGEMVLEGVVPTAGMALRWLRDAFFPGQSYAMVDNAAGKARKSNEVIFLPHLAGEGSPGWRDDARGSFHNLTLGAGMGDFACAVLEGVAFEIVRNIHEMERTGSVAGEIRIFGGGAKSELWSQIIADCTGKRVASVATAETACLGAAMLTSKNAIPAGCGRVFEPDISFGEWYRSKYKRYLEIHERLT